MDGELITPVLEDLPAGVGSLDSGFSVESVEH